MNVPSVRFNKQDRPEFYKTVNKRVNKYFKDKNLSKRANFNMKFKTVFMLALYFIPFFILLSGNITSTWGFMGIWAIMGVGMSGIGLSIMHDANHGSYSTNKKINYALGFLINFIGGFHETWKIQHNVLHHSFTNIEGYDEDIDQDIMRFSPTQKRKPFFKYQAFYAPFLYGLLSIFRFAVKDAQQLVRYNKMGIVAQQGLNYRNTMALLIFNKTWYFVLTLIVPILILDFPWWQSALGFFLMHYICGLILALVFQPAHVTLETDFFHVEENQSMENSWAVHEMRTTSNFAMDNRLFTWFIGGLNFQVEHHLFPHVCHVHYKDISSIVQQTAREFKVPYHSHKTFYDALKSHFKTLHQLGTGEYDKQRAIKNEQLVMNN